MIYLLMMHIVSVDKPTVVRDGIFHAYESKDQCVKALAFLDKGNPLVVIDGKVYKVSLSCKKKD